MRAGYLATALAVIGAVAVGLVFGVGAAPAPSTVTVALGLDGAGDPGLEQRRAVAVAQRTSACMTERSFRYLAIPLPAPAIPDSALDPVAWAARWGFGVSTAVGRTEPAVPDQNAANAATLDRAARDRYVVALHGGADDPGCLTAATDAVYGLRERLLDPLRDELMTLERAIEVDAAMEPVRAAWQACVTPAVAVVGLDRGAADRTRLPANLLEVFAARLTRDQGVPGGLARLRAVERQVAADVARCEAAFIADRARVAVAHEAAFVRTHREALGRIGAAIRDAERRLGEAP